MNAEARPKVNVPYIFSTR